MATANKSTALQIWLVLFACAMIIASVVAYVQYRNYTDADARLQTATKERTTADTARQTAATNLQSLKSFSGFGSTEEVGKPDVEQENTVIGQLKKLMTAVAPGDLAQPTISATLQKMGQELDNRQKELAGLNAKVVDQQQQITSLSSEYQKLVDAHDTARANAEKVRGEAQASKESEVNAKEKQVAEIQHKIQELQGTLEAVKAELKTVQDKGNNRIANLEEINRLLRTEKENREKPSFEVPSGLIEWVDRETNLVWINRGAADALHKGTSFSVYKQINKGVARGSQGIKGAIEVIQVLGPHQSEARITKSQISEPIVPGDPIYTPLWKAGEKEKFAFVGLIDLDKDGVSDRDVLHDIVSTAGGVIVDEVDDKGVRHPTEGNISVGTKFLVLGTIPDFTESKESEKEGHKKIGELQLKMRKEADEHGVRVVSLEDFLNYIGYDPGRRIYRPGVTSKWNLHQGAVGTQARTSNVGRPQSMGTVSGAFKGRGNTKLPESAGTTSKVFKPPRRAPEE